MANDIEKIILKMQGGQGKAREEANRKIEEQTNILKKLEETIKSQGGNIERNAEYQKANAKIEKEKFNLEKKTSGNRAKLQETKREDKKSKDKDTALLKKMAGSLGGLLKLGKITKVVKTGLFAGLSALAIGRLVGISITSNSYISQNSPASVIAVPVIPDSFLYILK